MKYLFFILSVIALNASAQNQTKIENVNAITFKTFIDAKKGILIDLRTPSEIKKEGIIPGALQIDFLDKNADQKISALNHNKTYLLYCAGGGRSADAAELMAKQGFLHVVNLEKGFDEWKKKSLPIEH